MHLILQLSDDNKLKALILILTVIQIGSWLIGMACGFNAGLRSEVILFALMYYISMYLKNIKVLSKFERSNVKILGSAIVLLIYFFEYCVWYIGIGKDGKIITLFESIINNQSSPLNIVAAFIIIFTALSVPLKCSKVTNKIATGTFAVLLIHDHNYFRSILWGTIIEKTNITSLGNLSFVGMFVLIVLVVFSICICIDFIRQKIEVLILKSNSVQQLCVKIDKILG